MNGIRDRGPPRKAIVLLMFSLLLLTLHGSLVQAADAWEMTGPQYKVGDHWEYEVNENGTQYTEMLKVDGVTDKYEIGVEASYQNGDISVSIDGRILLTIPDLSTVERTYSSNVTGSPTGPITTKVSLVYDPPFRSYQWPIKDHDKWNADTELETTIDINGNQTSDRRSLSVNVEVSSIEKIRVKAGEFNAVKIIMRGSENEVYIWYSAEVGNVVKEENSTGFSRELKSYSCQDPGKLKGTNGGGGGFDMKSMGSICLILPLAIGAGIGATFGIIFGMYSGYSSKIPRIKPKRRKDRIGKDGPKFCPKHGIRTEKRNGVQYCHECDGYPMTQWKYCPHHGVRLQVMNGAPHCSDCGGRIKW